MYLISIKSDYEIEQMKIAGEIVGKTHNYLKKYTKELDRLANEYIISCGATPSFLNLYGFPASVCISINQEVVHGIPSNIKLKDGDIVSIDIGACYKGYHGDSAWTYPVGKISQEKMFLLEHTKKALFEGLSIIKEGIHLGDVSNAIETYAKMHNLGVIKELVGHGIGNKVHENPDVPNYGKKNTGPILKAGMTIAVEPMLTLGSPDIYMLDDEWTIMTDDDLPSAHFEHTILVTKDGYTILTKR